MRIYKTYDLLIAAVLNYKGYACSLLGDSGGQRCSFVFELDEGDFFKAKDLVERFWQDKLLVEPRKFNSSIRTLKARTKEVNI